MYRIFFFFFLAFSANLSRAQLCQGSLGDPIVNITFGSGTNPGPALAAAATGYQYSASDCPNDGLYAVRNQTSACFGDTWYTVSADHTGNPNGYFMIVNATVQPSPFYIDTVRNLCANTTYEFASWLLNIIKPSSCNGNASQPNITFSIERLDGTVLQTFNSGNIPPEPGPVWKQFGFFFTTPSSVSEVVIRMVNNAAGGCGNDLLLDDITFRPCGPRLTPKIQNETTDTVIVCTNQSKSFSFNTTVSAGYTNPFFQWQQSNGNGTWTNIPNENATTLTVNIPAGTPIGNYFYRLAAAETGNFSSPQCRIYSDVLGVRVVDVPIATAANNSPVCLGAHVQLTATGGATYIWSGPSNFSSTLATPNLQNINAAQAGNYTVIVTNTAGCSASANTSVTTLTSADAVIIPTSAGICIGDSIQLNASGGDTYLWAPATGLNEINIPDPKASPVQSISYTVTATLSNGCADTATVQVNVFSTAIANAGPDKVTIIGSPVQLNGSVSGTYQSVLWSPSTDLNNATILTPISSTTVERTYVLTAVSNNNCGTSSDTMNVKFYNGIYIPNSFTPNNDGRNDTWSIPALNAFPDFQLQLYNRYGQLVFENKSIVKPWNGRFKGQAASPGAYVYIITYDKNKILKGSLLLIR